MQQNGNTRGKKDEGLQHIAAELKKKPSKVDFN